MQRMGLGRISRIESEGFLVKSGQNPKEKSGPFIFWSFLSNLRSIGVYFVLRTILPFGTVALFSPLIWSSPRHVFESYGHALQRQVTDSAGVRQGFRFLYPTQNCTTP